MLRSSFALLSIFFASRRDFLLCSCKIKAKFLFGRKIKQNGEKQQAKIVLTVAALPIFYGAKNCCFCSNFANQVIDPTKLWYAWKSLETTILHLLCFSWGSCWVVKIIRNITFPSNRLNALCRNLSQHLMAIDGGGLLKIPSHFLMYKRHHISQFHSRHFCFDFQHHHSDVIPWNRIASYTGPDGGRNCNSIKAIWDAIHNLDGKCVN